jgi:hypothetical protein
MPAPTSLELRQRLLELHNTGHTPAQIAQQLSLPSRTVRRLVALAGQPGAPQDLAPLPNCGRPLATPRLPLQQQCLQMRRDNPGWGAGRIFLEMKKQARGTAVPPRALSSAGCVKPI